MARFFCFASTGKEKKIAKEKKNILMHPRRRVFLSVAEVASSISCMRVVDVRYALKPAGYGLRSFLAGHIPGAAFADLDQDLSDQSLSKFARHPMPNPEKFIQWCKQKRIGIRNVPVLCYDDMCGALGAGRLWWMLDALGLEAYVLDGGVQEYIRAGLALEQGPEFNPPSTAADESWAYGTAFEGHVTLRTLPPHAKIVDARAEFRFATTVRPYGLDSVAGHIPGAVNHPYAGNILEENGRKVLRSEVDLRQKMESTLRGQTAAGHVFMCGSGVTCCHNIAVCRELGLGKPLLYSGSWSEYSGEHKSELLRQTIERYGFACELTSPDLIANPRATAANCSLHVGGDLTSWGSLSALQASAVHSLHTGESAKVYLSDGTTLALKVMGK